MPINHGVEPIRVHKATIEKAWFWYCYSFKVQGKAPLATKKCVKYNYDIWNFPPKLWSQSQPLGLLQFMNSWVIWLRWLDGKRLNPFKVSAAFQLRAEIILIFFWKFRQPAAVLLKSRAVTSVLFALAHTSGPVIVNVSHIKHSLIGMLKRSWKKTRYFQRQMFPNRNSHE